MITDRAKNKLYETISFIRSKENTINVFNDHIKYNDEMKKFAFLIIDLINEKIEYNANNEKNSFVKISQEELKFIYKNKINNSVFEFNAYIVEISQSACNSFRGTSGIVVNSDPTSGIITLIIG